MNVTLFVPTLNEIEGMKTIMPKIKPEWCSQILIVDGNSKDGTAEYARAQGYDVYVQQKKGIRHWTSSRIRQKTPSATPDHGDHDELRPGR